MNKSYIKCVFCKYSTEDKKSYEHLWCRYYKHPVNPNHKCQKFSSIAIETPYGKVKAINLTEYPYNPPTTEEV